MVALLGLLLDDVGPDVVQVDDLRRGQTIHQQESKQDVSQDSSFMQVQD